MENSMLDLSLKIVRDHGFPVFQCNDGSYSKGQPKAPLVAGSFHSATRDEKQIQQWWQQFPYSVPGVPTGPETGLLVIDIDKRSDINGEETLRCLGVEYDKSWQVCTASGGRHIYFRYPNYSVSSSAGKIGDGIDVRGKGGYIIFAGSITHIGAYEFVDGCGPEVADLEVVPHEFKTLLLNDTKLGKTFDKGLIPEGRRNSALFEKICMFMRAGLAEETVINAVRAVNESECFPPLSNKEVDQICRSAFNYRRVSKTSLTDLGNAERFAEYTRGRIIFCPDHGSWFSWNNTKWIYNPAAPFEYAKEVIRKISVNVAEDNDHKALKTWQKTSEGKARIDAMINLAIHEQGMSRNLANFDKNRDLLNTKNGLIDLKKGEKKPQEPTDYFMKSTGSKYVPGLSSSRWKEFVSQICQHNANMIEALQRAVGYSLTGHTREQTLFVMKGSGSNGKSIFLEILNKLFGDYSGRLSSSALLDEGMFKIPNDIARLVGKRFVVVSELPKKRIMNEGLIKEITGGDLVSARFLHKEFFEFRPQFKIWIGTNHNLNVGGDEYAMKRRIFLFHLKAKFEGESCDKFLFEKLWKEREGILNWALEGLTKYQNQGLCYEFSHFETAIDFKKCRSNVFAEFFSANLLDGQDHEYVILDDVARSFARALGFDRLLPDVKKTFTTLMEERGFPLSRLRLPDGDRVYGYRNLTLKTVYSSPF